MSDTSDALNNAVLTNVGVDQSELRKKQREIHEYDVDNKYEDMERRKEEMKINSSIDLTVRNMERIKQVQGSSTGYLMSARDSKVFLHDDFRGKIPYFKKNLILLAAETGQGKSTISANLTFHALQQGQKVLVITNEEDPADVYNRVSCLIRGWSYTKHEEFTDEQIEFFNKNIDALSHRMTVVDDNYSGGMGQTTTIEGMEAIFNSLLEKGHEYDVIIIDYYQNVDRSNKNPNAVDWQVQGMFAKLLDRMKIVVGAPIILLAQKKRAKKDEELSYKELVEGRKTISNAATCVAEISVDKSMFKTVFKVVKSRFAEAIGEEIEVGFNKGKYVKWSTEFMNKALTRKEQRDRASMLKQAMDGGEDEENK